MRWRRVALSAVPLAVAAMALPPAAAAGEFRLLLEGQAGMFSDGDYRGLDQDQAPLRNDDSRARAGLNLQLSYALERLNLAMAYGPSYERSLDNADVSGLTHRLDFGLVGDLTRRLQLDVRERLLKTPDINLYAPVTTPETTTVTRRGDQLSHALDVTLNHNFTRRASLLLGVSHSLRKFEEENLIDSEALGARIGAGFSFGSAQRVEAAAGLGRYDYKERGDADVGTFGIAWSTDFWRSSHVRVEAGAFSVDSTERVRTIIVPDPADPADPEEEPTVRETVVQDSAEGFRGSVQLSQERRFVRWALGLSHDVSPGAGLGRAVEADNAFVGLSFPVGRRLELGLDGSGSRQNDLTSRDIDVLNGASGDPDGDELTEFAAGTARASWTFAQAFRVEGGYSRVWQRSRVEAFGNLNYARYFLNLAFRLYQTGETPKEPESLGRPTDEASDDQ
ncbi:MAG TPA: hypothetical protein VHC97_08650 [Thermoanaerobaculia bacterium]|nr:hypothetical protein [Thermoanaerobaculia bacterium]